MSAVSSLMIDSDGKTSKIRIWKTKGAENPHYQLDIFADGILISCENITEEHLFEIKKDIIEETK